MMSKLCSKHVEAWNKLTVKQTFCASSWLITEINILRCAVSKRQNYCDVLIYKHLRLNFSLELHTKSLKR